MKKKIAIVGAVVALAASATLVYALQNIWTCAQASGGYTCWVSGTRG